MRNVCHNPTINHVSRWTRSDSIPSVRALLIAGIVTNCLLSDSGTLRASEANNFSLVIRNGKIVDGTGKPAFEADIAVVDGTIVGVGTFANAAADLLIDAEGMIVAPGFIDVHNHSAEDIAVRERRLNEGFVRQGVTTIVGGPDGELAPHEIRELIQSYELNGVGTNVAFYVGHNAIRRKVMRHRQRRPPTVEELEDMKSLVREGMNLGAVGFSTGLMYPPGVYSDTDEVVALAQEIVAFGGVYDSHVRNPAQQLIQSDEELIEIARRAGVPGKIAHLKAVGLKNEGAIGKVIEVVEAARRAGLNIVSDQYPYDGAKTSTLKGIIEGPPELRKRKDLALTEALADAELREVIRDATENGVEGGFSWVKVVGYSGMRILQCRDAPHLEGKYLSELSNQQDRAPFDAIAELLIDAKHPILITLGAIKEKDVRLLMVQDWNMIASDGFYVDANSRGFLGHPRSTGTFPRVLGHYVRDVQLLTLEEAIRKMTSLPADFLGLIGRGRITEGSIADIVILDPLRVRDNSTWTNPNAMPIGVRDVFVKGVPVLQNSTLTGQAPGRYIRRGKRSPRNSK